MDYAKTESIPIYSKYIPPNGFTYFPKLDLHKQQIYYTKTQSYSQNVPRSVWILDYELIEDIYIYGIHLQAYYSFTEPQFKQDIKYIPEHGFSVEDLVDNPRDIGNAHFKKLLKLRHDITSRLLFREIPQILKDNGVLDKDFCYIKDFNDKYIKELFNILKDRYTRELTGVQGLPTGWSDENILAKCYYINYFEDNYIAYLLTHGQMKSFLTTKKKLSEWDRRTYIEKKRDLNDILGKNCYTYKNWVEEQKEFQDFIDS